MSDRHVTRNPDGGWRTAPGSPRPSTWGIKRGGYTPVPTGHTTATPPPAPVDRGGRRKEEDHRD